MDFFLNNFGKILKVLIVTLISFLLLYFTLYVYGVEEKLPYEYGDSVWRCSDPNIELIYEGDEKKCIYYSPDGEVELDVRFDNAGRIYIVKHEGRTSMSYEDFPFKGDCEFDSDFFIVNVTRNKLFEGDYDELVFERIE